MKHNIRLEKKLKGISDTKDFPEHYLSDEILDNEIFRCVQKVRQNLIKYDGKFPAVNAEKNGSYRLTDNVDWTTGFWTGISWLCYKYTKDNFFKEEALKQISSFTERIKNDKDLNSHDIGCIYAPSCVAAYNICGDNSAKQTALLAAYKLLKRYTEKGKFIQAWGNMYDPNEYRLIIDGYICLPLLYWAYFITGDTQFKLAADEHANSSLVSIRQDYSTYHTHYFDVETGKPTIGKTHQGYSDESVWARGQSWAIWGMAQQYLYTKDIKYLDNFIPVTLYFLNNLPEDDVPYWDLIFQKDDSSYKDSSAAAIAACGIINIIDTLEENKEKDYIKRGLQAMMHTLVHKYNTTDTQEGLLDKSTYHASGKGVEVACLFGDYYYLEALVRLKNPELRLF